MRLDPPSASQLESGRIRMSVKTRSDLRLLSTVSRIPPAAMAVGGPLFERRPRVFVFYNYHSVPLSPQNVPNMLNYLALQLQRKLNHIFVGLDYQRVPSELMLTLQSIPNCHTELLASKQVYFEPTAILNQLAASPPRSQVLLVTDGASKDCSRTVQLIVSAGWQCIVVHPPRISAELLHLASGSMELPIHIPNNSKRSHVPPSPKRSHVRLYERRNRRDCSLSNSVKKRNVHKTTACHLENFITGPFDHETVLDALQTRNDFPEELTKALETLSSAPADVCPLNGFADDSLSKLHPSETIPPVTKEKTKMLVRWRKGTVNHEKLTSCTKNAQQCPKWDNKIHAVLGTRCNMWHPQQPCSYFPRCQWKADLCGFAHPFCCQGPCRCPPGAKDPQKHHFIREN